MGGARSRNELVSAAIRHELAAWERARIDAEFAGMADDAEYLAEADALVSDFARVDTTRMCQPSRRATGP